MFIVIEKKFGGNFISFNMDCFSFRKKIMIFINKDCIFYFFCCDYVIIFV